MKLYKFRPLGKEIDFQRANSIIETGQFWCSRFSELNDPMEGIFRTMKPEIIKEIYNQKKKYKICSFSGENAFKNPCMWGYYANGFKGIAIEVEIEVKKSDVKQITYKDDIINVIDNLKGNNDEKAEKILTTKLRAWEHEEEYRFLKCTDSRENVIGEITAIYFGEPYKNVYNSNAVYRDNIKLRCYRCLSSTLRTITERKDISCFSVTIEDGKVVGNSEF